MYCVVVEDGALLHLQQVQRVELALSAEGQNQRTPGRQLLLPRVNIGLQSEHNTTQHHQTAALLSAHHNLISAQCWE